MTTISVLTADDLRAMRTADSVTFRYVKGQGYIRLTLDGGFSHDVSRIYTAPEQRTFPGAQDNDRYREIAVDSGISGYSDSGLGEGWNGGTESGAYAFSMIHSAKYSDVWNTLVALMRTGDEITLSWTADNNTDTIREAGLHADELHLIIRRGKQRLTFALDRSTGRDNSARMIRRYGA